MTEWDSPPAPDVGMTQGMEATVDRQVFLRILDEAHGLGVDARRLRRSASLPAVLPDRVCATGLFRLWAAATSETQAGLPWQVAASVRIEDLGLFGYSVQTAATAQAALQTACDLFGLISEWRKLELVDDSVIRVTGNDGRSRGEATTCEAMLAHFALLSGKAAGELRIRAVHLRREVPSNDPSRTFGFEVRGDAAYDAVEFEPRTLGAPSRYAHAKLHAHVRAEAEAALGRLRLPSDVLSRTRAMIVRDLADGPSMERAAVEFGVSVRTLRRHLKDSGTSFRALVDDVRRARAERAVRETEVEIGALAESLGFSELSAFSRAYRRWFSRPPTAEREDR